MVSFTLVVKDPAWKAPRSTRIAQTAVFQAADFANLSKSELKSPASRRKVAVVVCGKKVMILTRHYRERSYKIYCGPKWITIVKSTLVPDYALGSKDQGAIRLVTGRFSAKSRKRRAALALFDKNHAIKRKQSRQRWAKACARLYTSCVRFTCDARSRKSLNTCNVVLTRKGLFFINAGQYANLWAALATMTAEERARIEKDVESLYVVTGYHDFWSKVSKLGGAKLVSAMRKAGAEADEKRRKMMLEHLKWITKGEGEVTKSPGGFTLVFRPCPKSSSKSYRIFFHYLVNRIDMSQGPSFRIFHVDFWPVIVYFGPDRQISVVYAPKSHRNVVVRSQGKYLLLVRDPHSKKKPIVVRNKRGRCQVKTRGARRKRKVLSRIQKKIKRLRKVCKQLRPAEKYVGKLCRESKANKGNDKGKRLAKKCATRRKQLVKYELKCLNRPLKPSTAALIRQQTKHLSVRKIRRVFKNLRRRKGPIKAKTVGKSLAKVLSKKQLRKIRERTRAKAMSRAKKLMGNLPAELRPSDIKVSASSLKITLNPTANPKDKVTLRFPVSSSIKFRKVDTNVQKEVIKLPAKKHNRVQVLYFERQNVVAQVLKSRESPATVLELPDGKRITIAGDPSKQPETVKVGKDQRVVVLRDPKKPPASLEDKQKRCKRWTAKCARQQLRGRSAKGGWRKRHVNPKCLRMSRKCGFPFLSPGLSKILAQVIQRAPSGQRRQVRETIVKDFERSPNESKLMDAVAADLPQAQAAQLQAEIKKVLQKQVNRIKKAIPPEMAKNIKVETEQGANVVTISAPNTPDPVKLSLGPGQKLRIVSTALKPGEKPKNRVVARSSFHRKVVVAGSNGGIVIIDPENARNARIVVKDDGGNFTIMGDESLPTYEIT